DRRGRRCHRRCRGWRSMDASSRRAPVGRGAVPPGSRRAAGCPCTPGRGAQFVHAARVAFRSARVSGPGWAMLPSAAGVIDPLLSTGFPLTLLGILRLLDLLERTKPGDDREAARPDDVG